MLDWIVKNISQRPTAFRLYFLLPRREPVSEDKAKNTTSLFSPFSPPIIYVTVLLYEVT